VGISWQVSDVVGKGAEHLAADDQRHVVRQHCGREGGGRARCGSDPACAGWAGGRSRACRPRPLARQHQEPGRHLLWSAKALHASTDPDSITRCCAALYCSCFVFWSAEEEAMAANWAASAMLAGPSDLATRHAISPGLNYACHAQLCTAVTAARRPPASEATGCSGTRKPPCRSRRQADTAAACVAGHFVSGVSIDRRPAAHV
jgi:hypothetical protein